MSGPLKNDLALFKRDPGVTLTQWLYEELRRAILDGRLRRGTRIPATRGIATEYGVSRRIVVNVFDQLRDEGYLTAKIGAGTRVSESVPEDFLAASPARRRRAAKLATEGEFYRRPVPAVSGHRAGLERISRRLVGAARGTLRARR